MSNDSCPIPLPEQRQFLEIKERVKKAMFEAISKVIAGAATDMAEKVQAAGIGIEPAHGEDFMFAAHS